MREVGCLKKGPKITEAKAKAYQEKQTTAQSAEKGKGRGGCVPRSAKLIWIKSGSEE